MRAEDLANELILYNPELDTFEVTMSDDDNEEYEMRSADGSVVQYKNGRMIHVYDCEDY